MQNLLSSHFNNLAELDMALGFWSILIPHALAGGALTHDDGDGMDEDGKDNVGWTDEYTNGGSNF